LDWFKIPVCKHPQRNSQLQLSTLNLPGLHVAKVMNFRMALFLPLALEGGWRNRRLRNIDYEN